MFDKLVRISGFLLISVMFVRPYHAAMYAHEYVHISAMTWNTDGSKVAIGKIDGSIEIRDIADNTSIFLGESVAQVTSFAWNPQNPNLIAVSHYAPRVRVFDITTGQRLLNLDTGLDSVEQVVWNADGTLLAAAANPYWTDLNPSYQIQIWDAEQGILLQTLEEHTDNIMDIAWSQLPSDHRLVSVSSDKSAIVWDTQTGSIIDRLFLPKYPLELSWNESQAQLAILTTDDVIYFWDTGTVPFVPLPDLTYSDTKHRIYSGLISNLVWKPNSPMLAFTQGTGIRIYVTNPQRPRLANVLPYDMHAFDWSVSDDLAFVDSSGALQIIKPPLEPDPGIALTLTQIYQTPTATPTPFGTPPPSTETPFPYPTPHAGQDQTVCTTNGLPILVKLDASNTIDPGNTIMLYRWYDGDLEIARGINPTVSLTSGIHHIRLVVQFRISELYSETQSDTVEINVIAVPAPTPP